MKTIAAGLVAIMLAGVLGAQNFTVSSTPVASFPQADANVRAMAEHNGKLYIGGDFTTVGGVARKGLAEIDLATNQVTSWAPDPDVAVIALAVHNNRLYVGGAFTQIAGQNRESLCSFDLSTGALTSWAPALTLPPSTQNIFFDNDVHVLEVVGDLLYVGGGFTAVDGTPRGHLCTFDLTNLSTSNGLTNWDPNVQASVSTSGSAPYFGCGGVQGIYVDPVSQLCVVTGGMVGAGGDHWHDGSASGHNSLSNFQFVASTTGTGSPSFNWIPDTVGYASAHIINTCYGIGSDCFISGLIGSVTSGGVTEIRNTAARMDMTGNTLTTNITRAFDPQMDQRIWAWESDPANSVLFAGGGFTTVKGQAVERLAILDPSTGAANTNWTPNPNTYVRSLLFTGDRLYVGGEFTTISGATRTSLAAYDVIYPNNNAPILTVTSNSSNVGNGGTLNVQQYSTLNALGLEIAVGDLDGDPVTLTGTVSGVGTTGILQSEFNQGSGATPYSLYPSTGVFDTAGTHTITLAASDGKGGNTSMSFSVVVSAGNAAPTIQVSVLMSPMSNNGSVPVEWAAPMSSLGIAITVDDADGDPVTLVGSIAPKGTTGTLDSEFTSIAQYGPYTLAPLTGQFTDPNTTHTVTLTADDGQGGITQFTFDLNVGDTPNSSDGGSGGGSSGGGGCAGATGSQAPLWLIAAMAALIGTAALRRRQQA